MEVKRQIEVVGKLRAFRRKTLAYYVLQFTICVPSAIIHGISWPLVALSGGAYLFYVGAISAEKILLAWINTKGRGYNG